MCKMTVINIINNAGERGEQTEHMLRALRQKCHLGRGVIRGGQWG